MKLEKETVNCKIREPYKPITVDSILALKQSGLAVSYCFKAPSDPVLTLSAYETGAYVAFENADDDKVKCRNTACPFNSGI